MMPQSSVQSDIPSGQQQQELVERRYVLGRDVLGPIFDDYLARLDEQIAGFTELRDAKVLFVSRAGVRIARLYEAYLARRGRTMPAACEHFWVSRLLAVKGTWSTHPAHAGLVFEREFEHARIADVIRAIYAPGQPPSTAKPFGRGLDGPGSSFREFIQGRSRTARATREELRRVGGLFDSHVRNAIGDHKTVLLVDSGWQGTTQTLLTDWRPDIDWFGAYFGVIGFEESDRRYWNRMRGLVFEADAFDPSRPATATVLHRHLIEDLLEPRGRSIEQLRLLGDGSVVAPGADVLLQDAPGFHADPMFSGVLDHVGALPADQTRTQTAVGAHRAWQRLARQLALPTRDDADVLGGQRRSHDFGKDGAAPVNLTPSDDGPDGNAESRIAASLWAEGQAALEYGPAIATQRQLGLLGITSPDEVGAFTPPPITRHDNLPMVTVVTRTMDRPMLLERAMASVASQTMQDLEQVVICDGGEIDPVVGVAAASLADPRRVRIIDCVVNRGMEAASNIAIRASDSRYIVIHDDDDSWEPEFLEKTTGFLNADKGEIYGGVVTNSWQVSEEITGNAVEVRTKKPYLGTLDRVDIAEMAIGNFYAPIAFLYRRAGYDRVGGYDERLPVLGDWDFNLRFLAMFDIGVVPDRMANYHVRDVGEEQLLGNSVTAGADKHKEYAAIARNRFVREADTKGGMAVAALVGSGEVLGMMRDEMRGVQGGRASSARAPQLYSPTAAADNLWVLSVTLAGARLGPALAAACPDAVGRWIARPFVLSGVRSLLSGRPCPPPPGFDEVAYLGANPDVWQAVKLREVPSGFAHYVLYGRAEGRAGPRVD